jgi:hypothetical protein
LSFETRRRHDEGLHALAVRSADSGSSKALGILAELRSNEFEHVATGRQSPSTLVNRERDGNVEMSDIKRA